MNKYYTCSKCGGPVCDVTVNYGCPHCGEGNEELLELEEERKNDKHRHS